MAVNEARDRCIRELEFKDAAREQISFECKYLIYKSTSFRTMRNSPSELLPTPKASISIFSYRWRPATHESEFRRRRRSQLSRFHVIGPPKMLLTGHKVNHVPTAVPASSHLHTARWSHLLSNHIGRTPSTEEGDVPGAVSPILCSDLFHFSCPLAARRRPIEVTLRYDHGTSVS